MKLINIILCFGIFFGVAWLVLAILFKDTGKVRLLSQTLTKPPSEAVAQQSSSLWRVTAYCPCEKCCGKFADDFTASGARAVGRIIAAPPEIPFGTMIFIEGYGRGTVQDRGGAIKGKRLDILFSTHQQALDWGVKHLRLDL